MADLFLLPHLRCARAAHPAVAHATMFAARALARSAAPLRRAACRPLSTPAFAPITALTEEEQGIKDAGACMRCAGAEGGCSARCAAKGWGM